LQDRTLDKNLSDLFFALGGLILLSLLLYGARLGEIAFFSLFAYPGALLYQIFLGMAYFFPLYLFGVGVFLRIPKVSWVPFWFLQALIVPVMTIALLLHISAESENPWSMNMMLAFGRDGRVFLLYALLVLEIAAMVVAFMVLPTADWKLWLAQLKGKFSGKEREPIKALPDLRVPEAKANADQSSGGSYEPHAESHGLYSRTNSVSEELRTENRGSEFVTPDSETNLDRSKEDIRQDPFFTAQQEIGPDKRDPYNQVMNQTFNHLKGSELDEKSREQSLERGADFVSPKDFDYQSYSKESQDQFHRRREEIVDWDRLKDGKMNQPEHEVQAGTEGSNEDRFKSEVYSAQDYEADYPGEEYFDVPIDPDLMEGETDADREAESALDRDLKYAAAVESFLPAEEDDTEPFQGYSEVEAKRKRLDEVEETMEQDPGEEELAEIFALKPESRDIPKKKKVLESTLPKEVPYVPRGQKNSYRGYKIPSAGLLRDYGPSENLEIDEVTRNKADILKLTLSEFKIEAEVTGIRRGPVITMFEILPAPGVRLSKIAGLADNIALRLAAKSVRIVAPIPGKHAVGIEVPNSDRKIVGFQELIDSRDFQKNNMAIPIALGKDISGEIQVIDLAKTPHLLIAGATGAGKSVSVNSLICSILYQCSPNDVKLMLVDPKIVELKFFNGIPHLLTEVITEPKKALQAVQWCLYEMERRYALLDALGVRDIKSYNNKVIEKKLATNKLPYLVFVVDEFADLMATSGKGAGRHPCPFSRYVPGCGNPPRLGHPTAFHRCDHRIDQGQLPQPYRLYGGFQDRQPNYH
jgi:S-DNA-T family DNA segregation ATPase FtsK/SpoIIIE